MKDKRPLRDRIIAVRNYPGERWRRRTVRNVLVVAGETRRTVADGFAAVNERFSEILERIEVSEVQHAELLIRQGIAFGRELPSLGAGESSPSGHLEQYFDAHIAGPGIFKWRHYFPIYERHLGKLRGRSANLVEIGVFSGGSLHMWREYLGPSSQVTGIDIEPACKAYEADGISVAIGDQGDPAFWASFLAEAAPIDAVIDDGSHDPADQITTLKALLPRLEPGGVYICEDVHGPDNEFARFIDGFTRNLDTTEPREWPDGSLSSDTTACQRSIASVHRYPFVTVIERTQSPVASFEAPRHGTEWLYDKRAD
ncbi:MAG: class I SAM-dependent methyltransferase [Solirubrobacterales bacterium]|nr:class I SAM-dependent methyltransferase [Solirubrobacterales bacterium]